MKIGICGLAGDGKDTFAILLKEEFAKRGVYFEIDRYAGLLKEAARQVFGEDFDNREIKEEKVFVTPELADKMIDATDYVQLKLGLNAEQFEIWNDLCCKHIDTLTWVSPRSFQQILGTEVGRTFDPDIWVNYLKNKLGNLIIPDVRFGNEEVDRSILIIRNPLPKGKVHPSEQYAVNLRLEEYPELLVDHIVMNRTTIEDLRKEASFIVNIMLIQAKAAGVEL